MSLEKFYDESFTVASDLSPVDQFIGTGVDNSFTLIKKSGTDLANTITAGSLQSYQFNGGFTKSGNTFILSYIPNFGVQIVAPGIVTLTFDAYDQDAVDGVSNPRVKEKEFYLGDPITCHLYSYTNLPQFTGISLSFVELVSSVGANLSWVQLACSDPSTGLAMTYGATGAPLYTGQISSMGTLSASSGVGASSVFTTSASSFTLGDYVILNIGNGTSEMRKIASKTNTSLTFFTSMDYAHASGESVFTFGRKFWAKVTVPINSANNQAFNFWNLGLRRQCKIISKV